MIKIVAPRMAQNVVDRAMQVCLELQQFYTRALAGNALLKMLATSNIYWCQTKVLFSSFM